MIQYFLIDLRSKSAVNALTMEQRGRLLTACFDYISGNYTDVEENTAEPIVNIVFQVLKADIDKAIERMNDISEKRRAAGRAGAAVTNEIRWGDTQQQDENLSANVGKCRQMSANVSKIGKNQQNRQYKDNNKDKDNNKNNNKDNNKSLLEKKEKEKKEIFDAGASPCGCSKKKADIEFVKSLELEEWEEIVCEWVEYREQQHRFKYVPVSLIAFIKRLKKESGGSITTARNIIETAMSNGWQGCFFNLPNDRKPHSGSQSLDKTVQTPKIYDTEF